MVQRKVLSHSTSETPACVLVLEGSTFFLFLWNKVGGGRTNQKSVWYVQKYVNSTRPPFRTLNLRLPELKPRTGGVVERFKELKRKKWTVFLDYYGRELLTHFSH